jgi:hypothetical protein
MRLAELDGIGAWVSAVVDTRVGVGVEETMDFSKTTLTMVLSLKLNDGVRSTDEGGRVNERETSLDDSESSSCLAQK